MKHYLLLCMTLITIQRITPAQLPSNSEQELLDTLQKQTDHIKKRAEFLAIAFKKDFSQDSDGLQLEKLIAEGVDVNTQADNGKTALIHAAQTNRAALACFLFKQPELDGTIRDENEKTAFDYAEKHTDKTIYSLLQVTKKIKRLKHYQQIAVIDRRIPTTPSPFSLARCF